MNPRFQDYRRALLEMQGKLRPEVERMIAALPEETQPPGEHERAVLPTESIEVASEIENAEEALHRAVAEALERIEAGTFGRCEGCGCEIPEERLRALPYTSYCIHCERTLERSERTIPRR